MDFASREILINRIGAGLTLCRLDRLYYLVSPTLEDKYLGDTIYSKELKKAEKSGVFDDDSLFLFLIKSGLWSDEEDERLEKIQKDIENLKIQLFDSYFQPEKQDMIRIAIKESREEFKRLYFKLHSYDYMSCKGVAGIARSRFVALMSLRTLSKKRVVPRKNWSKYIDLADDVIVKINESKIEEEDLRELAKTDPWRSYWPSKPFRGSPLNWSEDQKTLVAWSRLYDWIYKHPEKPSETIVQDDDCIDGWLIKQRRKMDSESEKSLGESLVKNQKIKNMQEVYIAVDSREGARRVHEMNDSKSKRIKSQRLKYLKEKGMVNELDMPDTNQRLITEATQLINARAKNG